VLNVVFFATKFFAFLKYDTSDMVVTAIELGKRRS
jgi:hypothetical protein